MSAAATDKATPTRFRWGIVTLIFLIYAFASADRANIGIVLPYLKEDFHLTNAQTGGIVSLFFLAYALGQIPSAFIIKRFGVSRVLPLSMLLTSVATGLHGVVTSVLALKVCRIILGAAEAPIGNACMTTINNWFPEREKGTAAGIFMAAAKIGPVIVPPLGALIIVGLGWHYVFLLFALPGLLLPWIWLRLVPDDPAGSRHVNREEVLLIREPTAPRSAGVAKGDGGGSFLLLDSLIRVRPIRLITTNRGVFLSWNIWGVSLSYFLFVGTMNVILAWLPTYLRDVKGFSIVGVGFVAAAPFVGAVTGNMLGGLISDRLLDKRRKPLMMLSCIATVIMMHILRSAPNNPVALSALLGTTGLVLTLGFSLYPIFPAGLTDKATFPIAVSLINTCGQLGGAAMPFVTGVILDAYSWDKVFLALSVCAFIALCLLATIVEPRGVIEPTGA